MQGAANGLILAARLIYGAHGGVGKARTYLGQTPPPARARALCSFRWGFDYSETLDASSPPPAPFDFATLLRDRLPPFIMRGGCFVPGELGVAVAAAGERKKPH